jgi:hypothetical protein
MATILHGKLGSAAFTAAGAVVLGDGELTWTLEITGDTADTTSATDAVFVGRVGTFSSWTATVTSNDSSVTYTDSQLVASMGQTASLVLKVGSASSTYTGNGILTGFGKGMDTEGVFQYTFNFQGTGAIVLS